MNIVVNGQRRECEAAFSVQRLLEVVGVKSGGVIVELNRVILPQGDYSATILKDDDRLEIIQFVAGG